MNENEVHSGGLRDAYICSPPLPGHLFFFSFFFQAVVYSHLLSRDRFFEGRLPMDEQHAQPLQVPLTQLFIWCGGGQHFSFHMHAPRTCPHPCILFALPTQKSSVVRHHPTFSVKISCIQRKKKRFNASRPSQSSKWPFSPSVVA